MQTEEQKMKNNNTIILLIIFALSTLLLQAQEVENEFEYRTSVYAQFKPLKKLKVYISPEARFDEDFSLGEYNMEAGATYKLSSAFSVGANYRFIINPRESKETEYYSRYKFYVTLKQKYGDFTPSVKLSYSNFADDDKDNELNNYLRYKASLEYDIPKSKLTPVVGIEAFHNLNDKEISKIRYSAGADYKLFKNNYIGLRYKFDFYRTSYKNRHVFGLQYKIKF
jgi:isopentenyldiphosphate isomerase